MKRAVPWLALALALGACEYSEPRRRRAAPTTAPSEPTPDAPRELADQLPPEHVPGIVRAAPVDLGVSPCPGSRLLRVDRRVTHGPDADSPRAPPPLYFGLDRYGRVTPLSDLLLCALRAMHFIVKGLPEGVNLVLLHGPRVFEPDNDCEWRELSRTERYGVGDGGLGGRYVWLRARCRRRLAGGPGERTIRVEVAAEYAALRVTAE